MRDRLRKIERIRQVQAKLHRLEETRLAHIDREKAAIRQDEESLIAALNEHDALQGIFIDAMARRLNVLARRAEETGRARIAQNRVLTEAGLRLKRTERLAGAAGGRRDDEERKKAFESLLQLLSTADDASLP